MPAHNLVQGKLQQLEEALLAASVGGLAADGDESGVWWGRTLVCWIAVSGLAVADGMQA